MICPKCGDKYEDDMPRCLWCDALNPNFGQVDVQTECSEQFTPELQECQLETVLKQSQDDINGFTFLDKNDEQDLVNDSDRFIEYKIARPNRIECILLMIFFIVALVFVMVEVFFVDGMKSLWPIWLVSSAVYAYAIYVFSKTVFAVEWFKDKFILKTLYGEKEFLFNESFPCRCGEAGRDGFGVYLKKGMQTFVLREKAFPDVVKMLCQINGCSTDKTIKAKGAEYITYKPLGRRCSMLTVLWQGIIGLLLTVVCLFNGINGNVDSDWFCCLCLAILFWVEAYRNSKQIFEIRWFKDKFIFCTRYGEKTFSFDKSELQKMKRNDKGFRRFVFEKNGISFVVDEHDFPQVVEMMGKLYD
jgi:hypothetical protein